MSSSEDLRKQLEQLLAEEEFDWQALERLADGLAGSRAASVALHRNQATVDELRRLCERYHEPLASFQIGDVVRWKAGLKNKTFPAYDQPAVVFEVLDPPVPNPATEGGSQYFGEELNLVIGHDLESAGEDRFGLFHVDGRRFEIHPEYPSRQSRKKGS